MTHEEGHANPLTGQGFGIDENDFEIRNVPGIGTVVFNAQTGQVVSVLSPEQADTLSERDIAQLGIQAANLDQRIAEASQRHGIDLAELSLRGDQLAVSEQAGRRGDAITLTGIVASVQGRIDTNNIALAQMQQQAQALQAQLNAQAAQAGADRAFQAAQQAANRAVQRSQILEQSRSRNIDQQIQIATSLADFTRDPGDIVANIAAIEQLGGISTALAGGFSGLTDEALDVGGRFLGAQDLAVSEGERISGEQSQLSAALQNALQPQLGVTQPAAPQVPQVQASELQQIDIGGLFNEILGQLQPQAAAPAEAAAPAQIAAPAENVIVEPSGAVQAEAPQSFLEDEEFQRLLREQQPELSFAEGGIGLFNDPTTISVAENGPEILIGLPQPSEKERLRDRTRSLLSEAFEKAFKRFQLAAPNIPTFAGGVAPVGVSAPGTSILTQQAAAGLTAAGSGVTRQAFGEDLARSRATGIQQGVARRTR